MGRNMTNMTVWYSFFKNLERLFPQGTQTKAAVYLFMLALVKTL